MKKVSLTISKEKHHEKITLTSFYRDTTLKGWKLLDLLKN